MNAPNAVVLAAPRIPLLDDPEVRAAFEGLARAALEDLARELAPVLDRARSLPDEAELIPCSSEEECDFLQAWLGDEVARVEKRGKEIVDPYAGFAHRAHRTFTALRALVTDETAKASAVGKRKILAWARVVEERRRGAEERARREREEAERLVVVARAPYLLHVAIAQVAELMQREEEKRIAAKAAEDAGDTEAATAITEELGRVEVPTIQPDLSVALPEVLPPLATPQKPKGIARNFKGRLRRPLIDLIRFVAEHPEWESLLELNQSSVDKAAKLHETKLSQVVPALEAYDDPTVRRARRR